MAIDFKIPDVGESITEVQIGDWRKSEGDKVQEDEILVEVETDKASMELPAPADGVLERILKQSGETANVGDVIASIADSNGAPIKADSSAKEPVPADRDEDTDQDEAKNSQVQENSQPEERHTDTSGQAAQGDTDGRAADTEDEQADGESEDTAGADENDKSKASSADDSADGHPEAELQEIDVEPRVMPDAKRELAKHGLTQEEVRGSGPGGRVLREDVLKHVSPQNAESRVRQPSSTRSSRDQGDEVQPMSKLRQTIARRLVEAQSNAALLTTFNEVDMSQVIWLRREFQDRFQESHEIKLGFMSFFVKATVEALKRIPELNAEVQDGHIVYHKRFDIGVAVATDRGLVVPVLRAAERLSFAEIGSSIRDLAQRATQSKLTLEELKGGTFTISNGGIYGSLLSTPIVNPPQSGVLGLHAIQDRPVARDGDVLVRPMMYMALTYDHRIIDGKESVTFLKYIKELIETPARMLLEI